MNAETIFDRPRQMANDSSAKSITLVAGELLVAEVILEVHPVTPGRVLVEGLHSDGTLFESWLSALQSLVLRAGDRVTIQHPSNYPEPIINGVLDSVDTKPVMARETGAELSLQSDETLRVNDRTGAPLLDIMQSDSGPIVQLYASMSALDMTGTFKLTADAVEIDARQGEMKLAASGDIHVDGEVINLN